MFRGWVISVVLASAAVSGCAAQKETELDKLISRVAEARGGAEALDAVQNIRTRLQIADPKFTVTGDYRATKDGLMRIDVYAGDVLVYSEGIDSQGAWARNGGKDGEIIPVSGAAAQSLAHGIEFNLFGLHSFEDRGHALSLDGEEQVGDTVYKVIRVTLADGYETYFYINPETWRIERSRDARGLDPTSEPDKKLMENVNLVFDTACGVLGTVSSQRVEVESGAVVQKTSRLNQTCNLAPDDLNLERSDPPLSQT